jgi:hypothetical protein
MSVQRVAEFDLWRPGYGNAIVSVYQAGTTTLQSIYEDEALTIAASNPQTLMGRVDDNGTIYGKFEVPLYVESPYSLHVDTSNEDTGVVRPPLTSLDDADASEATVKITGSSTLNTLDSIVSRVVYAENYGAVEIGNTGSAATNTTTVTAAIGALGNGGDVILPAGRVNLNAISLPQGCVLVGQGRDSTSVFIISGSEAVTLDGDRAGLRNLKLDGSVLTSGSVGVDSQGMDEIVLSNVDITRFETAASIKGSSSCNWSDLFITNCDDGLKLDGKTVVSANISWNGGSVRQCSNYGFQPSYDDAQCRNIRLTNVDFADNLGIACNINGAQRLYFDTCSFSGNTNNVTIADDTATLTPSTQDQNDVVSVHFTGGRMSGGSFTVSGTAQDIILDGVDLRDVDFNLNTPISNPVLLRNCTEDENVTISGEGTKIIRSTDTTSGASAGITSSNVATKAWSMALEPGQVVYLEVKVIGRQQNGVNRAIYHGGVGAYRPAATLAYDTQTANFTVGTMLTGATSGAKGRIVADADGGTTGTLTLQSIVGTFIDNEIITDTSTGSATANGTQATSNVSLDAVGFVSFRTAYETNANWAITAVANGPEIEIRVTGDTAQTVEWSVDVEVVST